MQSNYGRISELGLAGRTMPTYIIYRLSTWIQIKSIQTSTNLLTKAVEQDCNVVSTGVHMSVTYSQIIAMNVCAAARFPFTEYSAKHAVCNTQKTNMPIWLLALP